WSAPSAIGTGGMGFGGQIGAEMTDFVIVLNSREAVKSFSHGVSIEGSVIVERKDANAKFYNRKVTAKELLSGKISPPPQADILYRALNSRALNKIDGVSTMYKRRSEDGEEGEDAFSENSTVSTRNYRHSMPSRSLSEKKKSDDSVRNSRSVQRALSTSNNSSGSDKSHKPKPPIAPKPVLPPRAKKPTMAVALYDFSGEQEGDLGFSKGDLIVIIKKTESTNDWY
ncbi:10804_t:CDS:2, partial [Acaulospora colombiana]